MIRVLDATTSPELTMSRRNFRTKLEVELNTSVGLIIFQTLKPKQMAMEISVAAHIEEETVVVVNAAVISESRARIKPPDVNAKPMWTRTRSARIPVMNILPVKEKNR